MKGLMTLGLLVLSTTVSAEKYISSVDDLKLSNPYNNEITAEQLEVLMQGRLLGVYPGMPISDLKAKFPNINDSFDSDETGSVGASTNVRSFRHFHSAYKEVGLYDMICKESQKYPGRIGEVRFLIKNKATFLEVFNPYLTSTGKYDELMTRRFHSIPMGISRDHIYQMKLNLPITAEAENEFRYQQELKKSAEIFEKREMVNEVFQ
ncbi:MULTISPECIES: hypothetical protein [Vibrio]|nr:MULTISPECIES: hypothetical protein [Vibrio]